MGRCARRIIIDVKKRTVELASIKHLYHDSEEDYTSNIKVDYGALIRDDKKLVAGLEIFVIDEDGLETRAMAMDVDEKDELKKLIDDEIERRNREE